MSITRSALVNGIRQLIVEGHYSPDTPLSEASLAALFQVSRTPVREALKELERDGLVEIRPRVGTFVRQPSVDEMIELYEIKEVIDGLAARLVAARGSGPQVELLQKNVELSRDAVKAGDAVAYSKLVLQFHSLLVDASQSAKLGEHYELLMQRLQFHNQILRTLKAHSERMSHSVKEHAHILAYLVDGDPEGAEIAMREHVRVTAKEAVASVGVQS